MTTRPPSALTLHLCRQSRLGLSRTCLKCGRDESAWRPGDGSTHLPREWEIAVNRCTPETRT